MPMRMALVHLSVALALVVVFCLMGAVLAGASQQQSGEASVTACFHDEEVGGLCGL
jgi:hypothetical protein